MNNQNKINNQYKDIVKIIKNGSDEIHSIELVKGKTDIWQVVLKGPQNTPYSDLLYRLTVTFPLEYPFISPKITFDTPILHPNISDKGEICLDMIKDNWSPSLSMAKIFTYIRTLMISPNTSDPLSPEISKLYQTDRNEYNKTVRTHAEINSHKPDK